MEDVLCPVTGGYGCHCKIPLAVSELGNAWLADPRSSLRKIFTDHAVFTSNVVMSGLPRLNGDNGAWIERVLQNPVDLARALEPIKGEAIASDIQRTFAKHLKLAAGTLAPLRSGNAASIKKAVTAFLEQSTEVAEAIVQLNPDKVDFEYINGLFREHNNMVVKLATERNEERYEDYVVTYDKYYAHMLMFSDLIYETLTR